MNTPARQFKFSGVIAPQDTLHQVTQVSPGASAPDEHYLAPTTISITITDPPPKRMIGIPQYSPTVRGTTAGYSPAEDCDGNFMSYKFQPHNNCYAYACNITPNTFPQPGRASGSLITASTLNGSSIQSFAQQDGVMYCGTSITDIKALAQKQVAVNGSLNGHFVALMISPAGDANWPGDYHWARCDDNINFTIWSQKDGNDQVTNFDFAGAPITDPSVANWSVNQGPVQPDKSQPNYNPDDLIVDYVFYCYMFVPDDGVNII